jgi:hypothetical protein
MTREYIDQPAAARLGNIPLPLSSWFSAMVPASSSVLCADNGWERSHKE